jgi:hypothetical protein
MNFTDQVTANAPHFCFVIDGFGVHMGSLLLYQVLGC